MALIMENDLPDEQEDYYEERLQFEDEDDDEYFSEFYDEEDCGMLPDGTCNESRV